MRQLLIILCLLAFSASALTVNDTLLNMSGKAWINVTYPWTMDKLAWNTTWAAVWNLNSSHPNQTGTYELTYNFTSRENLTGYQMPYVSTFNNNQIIITYAGNNPFNVSFAACISYLPISVSYHSALGNFTSFTGTSFNTATHCGNVSVLTLEKGANQINFTYASSAHSDDVAGICNRSYLAMGLAAVFLFVAVGAMIIGTISLKSGSPMGLVTSIGGGVITLTVIFITVATICG